MRELAGLVLTACIVLFVTSSVYVVCEAIRYASDAPIREGQLWIEFQERTTGAPLQQLRRGG